MSRYLMNLVFVFFFKQKTAYEMRISDWSSDVCSSDLCGRYRGRRRAGRRDGNPPRSADDRAAARWHPGRSRRRTECRKINPSQRVGGTRCRDRITDLGDDARSDRHTRGARRHRSEEHTSELQSLMRISYAVFCLKNKKKNQKTKKRLN